LPEEKKRKLSGPSVRESPVFQKEVGGPLNEGERKSVKGGGTPSIGSVVSKERGGGSSLIKHPRNWGEYNAAQDRQKERTRKPGRGKKGNQRENAHEYQKRHLPVGDLLSER